MTRHPIHHAQARLAEARHGCLITLLGVAGIMVAGIVVAAINILVRT